MSAVKALAIAAQQGDRIYQITSDNIGILDELNIGAEIKNEIRAAVATDKEATVSKNTITVAGWTGAGYIISDPETGAGAYRISGGRNGATFIALMTGVAQGAAVGAMTTMFFASIAAGGLAVLAMTLFIAAFLLPMFLLVKAYGDTVLTTQSEQDCLAAGNIIGIILASVIAAFKEATYKGFKEIVAGISSALLIEWWQKIAVCV